MVCAMIGGDAAAACRFMYLSIDLARAGPFHSPFAHDEFSGTLKVSPLDQTSMTIAFNRLRRTAALRAIAICAMSFLAAGNASAADDASRWDGDARSAMRLIASSSATPERAPIRAGIEIRLKNGWHTYWRYPGDAGVPPRFDFTGSQNVKSVEVAWPAPHAFTDDSGTSIGYKNGVIFPLRIVPDDP